MSGLIDPKLTVANAQKAGLILSDPPTPPAPIPSVRLPSEMGLQRIPPAPKRKSYHKRQNPNPSRYVISKRQFLANGGKLPPR